MTAHPAGTRRPASLPGGVTGDAGQPVTWSSPYVDDPPITAGSGSKSSPRPAQDAVSRRRGETWRLVR